MNSSHFTYILLSSFSLHVCFINFLYPNTVFAQQTNNSSTLTNSAAPSASSVTTGGTNINYQSNNTFNNDTGFAPGIYCRTPAAYFGGNWGNSTLDAFDPIQITGNKTLNFSLNAGIVIPFGSQIIDYCKQIASAIAKDRDISSELSFIRVCSQLEKEGIKINPKKYRHLKLCIDEVPIAQPSQGSIINQPQPDPEPTLPASLKQKTLRVL